MFNLLNLIQNYFNLIKESIAHTLDLYLFYRHHKINNLTKEFKYDEIDIMMLNNINSIYKHLKALDQDPTGDLINIELWRRLNQMGLWRYPYLTLRQTYICNERLKNIEKEATNYFLLNKLQTWKREKRKELKEEDDIVIFEEVKPKIRSKEKRYTECTFIETEFYEKIILEKLKIQQNPFYHQNYLGQMGKQILSTNTVDYLNEVHLEDIKWKYLKKDFVEDFTKLWNKHEKAIKEALVKHILHENTVTAKEAAAILKKETKEEKELRLAEIKLAKDPKLVREASKYKEGVGPFLKRFREGMVKIKEEKDKEYLQTIRLKTGFEVHFDCEYKNPNDFLWNWNNINIINQLADKSIKILEENEDLVANIVGFLHFMLDDVFIIFCFLIFISYQYFLCILKIGFKMRFFFFNFFIKLFNVWFWIFEYLRKKREKKVKFHAYMRWFNSKNYGLVESIDKKVILDNLSFTKKKQEKLAFLNRVTEKEGIIKIKKKNNYFFSFNDILLKKPKYNKVNINDISLKGNLLDFYSKKIFEINGKIKHELELHDYLKEHEEGFKHMSYILNMKNEKEDQEIYKSLFSNLPLNKYKLYFYKARSWIYRQDALFKRNKKLSKNPDWERLGPNVFSLDMNIYERKGKIEMLPWYIWYDFYAKYFKVSDFVFWFTFYYMFMVLGCELAKHIEVFIWGNRFSILVDCLFYCIILASIHLWIKNKIDKIFSLYYSREEEKTKKVSDFHIRRYKLAKEENISKIYIFIIGLICILLFISIQIKPYVSNLIAQNLYMFDYLNLIVLFSLFFVLICKLSYKLIKKLKYKFLYILIFLLVFLLILAITVILSVQEKNDSILELNPILIIIFNLFSLFDVVVLGLILIFIKSWNNFLTHVYEIVKQSEIGSYDSFIVHLVEKFRFILHFSVEDKLNAIYLDLQNFVYPFFSWLNWVLNVIVFVILKYIFILMLIFVLFKMIQLILYRRRKNKINTVKEEIYEDLNVFHYSKINKVFYRFLIKDMLNLEEIKNYVNILYTYIKNRND